MLQCKKLKRFFSLLIFCICLQQHVQAQGCIDTIVSKQFDVENFGVTIWGGTNYQDSLGNLYLTGSRYTQANPPLTAKIVSTLIKFDANKKISWAKSYPGSIGFDDFSFLRRIFGQDNDHNLYFMSSGLAIGGTSSHNNGSFLKTDSSGNIIANKLFIKPSFFPQGYGFTGLNNTGKVFSTLVFGYRVAVANLITFAALDKDLTTIRWSKSYITSVSNMVSSLGNYSIELDDTTSVAAAFVSYKNPSNLTDTVSVFTFLKIKSLTGSIADQKSYSCFSLQNPNKTIYASPRAVNINYNSKEVIYQFGRELNNNTIFTLIKVDENLNIVSTTEFVAGTRFDAYNFNKINDSAIVLNATYTQNGIKRFATISWNTNLQLTSQRVYYSSQFTQNSLYANLTSKNANNTINYFITTQGIFLPGAHPIYLFDNTKNPNFEFDCTDKDIGLFSPVAASVLLPHTLSFTEQPGLNYNLINNPNVFSVQNSNFTESKFCDEVSICTNLKIQGKSSFCLNQGNIDSFKVIRNNTCLRKTKWSVNNTQMQVLQSNDTSIRVKFLQPFKGYIKAVYENCNVADSLYIEVDTMYNIKTGVYLGNDTIQCIGRSVVLDAGDGFKKYRWQDGSTTKTFATSDTGLFYVAVNDSCDNMFKDSVYIFPNPKELNLVQNGSLCEYDTAKIILPGQFTDYLWLPATGVLIRSNNLLLFPTGNTLYTISAVSHKNCRVEDTLLIKKKDCYGSIYFPTAFTPDNNGINDIYKPFAVGILQSFRLSIYNRYGQLVFTTGSIDAGWDGTFKGKLLAGAFTWICNYTFRSRKPETETGSFVLIR